MNQNGYAYVEGASTADFNRERIKTSIADQFLNKDNIMSVMHDDFRKVGISNTFKANLNGFLNEMNSSQPGFYASLGIDANRDGEINSEDWDSQEDIKTILQAITNENHPLYKYETSKSIVADWLTMHAEKKFYGDANPNLIPNDGETIDEIKEKVKGNFASQNRCVTK